MNGATMETEHRQTWADLVRDEPALAALEAEIRRVKAHPGRPFCANAVWYGYGGHRGFKPRLLSLVGWHARNPELRRMLAYDTAYEHLYSLLPDCRECGCL